MGGSVACESRRCTLHQSGALSQWRSVRSRRDVQEWVLSRRVSCTSRDTVYYILCPCGQISDYVGSTFDFKGRWSLHKSDIRLGRWTACGLTRHFGQHHQGNIEEAIGNLRVTLVDRLTGPHSEENLLRLEQTWMHRLGTTEAGCNSRVELTARNRRNWGTS